MGVIWHEALIIEGYEDLEELHKCLVAVAKSMPDGEYFDEPFEQLISPVMKGLTNGYCWIFIAPDGSKEGWDTSDRGDEFRQKIVKVLKAHNRDRGVSIRWGDYDPTAVNISEAGEYGALP